MTESKPTYEELEKKYTDLESRMIQFFTSKVITKLPFGNQSKPFYIEVMVSKETYKQIVMYNEIMDAIDKCEIKNISEAPQEVLERLQKQAEERTEQRMEELNDKSSQE